MRLLELPVDTATPSSERVIVDLTFRAEGPAASADAAPDRFGQPGRYTGEVWISGDEYRFDVPGVRERTWGEAGVTIPELRRRVWATLEDGRSLVVDRRVDLTLIFGR